MCRKCKVNFNRQSDTTQIEFALLLKVLIDSVGRTSPEELRKLVDELKLTPTGLTPEAVVAALMTAISLGKFQAYQLAVIVSNAVLKAMLGRGLSLAGNAALTRLMGTFAGPIGWTLTGLWTLTDIAGPAYRVTVPAVIYVSYLRIKCQPPANE